MIPSDQMTHADQWSHYSRYLYLLSKLLFFGLIIWLATWLLGSLSQVLFPIFVSLLIAYLLDPGIDWLEERGVKRTPGILLFLFIGLVGLVGIVLFLYPTITRQIGNIVKRVPELIDLLQNDAIPWVEETFKYEVPATFEAAFAEYGTEVKQAAPDVLSRVGEWLSSAVTQTGAIVVSLLNLIMIPIFTFYFLRDFDRMKSKSKILLPSYRRDFLMARLELMDDVVGEWFRGQLQVAGILGVLYAIGLGAVFGLVGINVTSGIAIGIVMGILNVIPYFGVLIGVILTAIIVILEWSGIGAIIGVSAVFVVVQVLEGYVITPKVVGEKVGLSPVTVIIVLLLGGELGGLLGILLAIPVAGAFKVILPDLIEYYRTTPFYTGASVRPAFSGAVEPAMTSEMTSSLEADPDPESESDDKTS
jgi:predicted PurR-regulated permease PerM